MCIRDRPQNPWGPSQNNPLSMQPPPAGWQQPFPTMQPGYNPYPYGHPFGGYYPNAAYAPPLPELAKELKLYGRNTKTQAWVGIKFEEYLTTLQEKIRTLGLITERQKIDYAKTTISSDFSSEARQYMLKDNSCLLYTSDAADERSSV